VETEKGAPVMSGCCGAVRFLADVWLWKPGRKKIGEVVMCAKCLRPLGTLKMEPDAPPEFTGDVWREMQKKTGGDKFYCEFQGGQLVPIGGKVRAKPTTTYAAMSAQDND